MGIDDTAIRIHGGINKTADHGNAHTLSWLLVRLDTDSDKEECKFDDDAICTLKTIILQLNPADAGTLPNGNTTDNLLSRTEICQGGMAQ